MFINLERSKLYNPTDSSSQHLFHMQPSQNIWQHPLFRQNFRGAETQVDNRTFNYTSFLLSILEFPMDLRMRKDRIHYLQKVQYTVASESNCKKSKKYSKSKFPVNYIQNTCKTDYFQLYA